jgi:multicomponent Na+:H+ antiporter subunit D
VKTTLFLVGGLVEHTGGSSRLSRLGGMAAATPSLAVLFLLPALSLAGIPPFSGFAAKFGLFQAAAGSEQWTILAVALVVSLLTLFSVFKIWVAVFWAPRQSSPDPADERERVGVTVDSSPSHAGDGHLDERVGASTTATDVEVVEPAGRGPMPRLMLVPTAVLALLTLAIGVAAGPLYELADRAAGDLLDPTAYREAVLGP